MNITPDVLQHTQQVTEYIAAIVTAAVTILAFLVKYGPKIINPIIAHIKERIKMVETLKIIHAELTPNHGTSLKDKITNMQRELVVNTELTQENTDMLKVLSARQQWILDMQKAPIFESDSEGYCTWVNDAYAELVGRDKDDILGNGWKNLIHEDDRYRVIAEWDRAVTEERSSQSTYRIMSKNGRVHEVECYATKHKNNGYSGRLKLK
jgi:PAS domain S-box-containing protein